MTEQMKQALEKVTVEDTGKKKDYPISTQDACMHGASLFVKLLWHNVSEKPVFDPANIACNQILVIGEIKSSHGDFAGSVCEIMDDGTIYAPISGHNYEWGTCPFSKWAYLKDIIPDNDNK